MPAASPKSCRCHARSKPFQKRASSSSSEIYPGFFILSIVSSGSSDSGNEFPSVPAKPHFFAAGSSQLLIEAGRVRIPCWGLPFHRRALNCVRLLCNHLHHFRPSATVAVRPVKIYAVHMQVIGCPPSRLILSTSGVPHH